MTIEATSQIISQSGLNSYSESSKLNETTTSESLMDEYLEEQKGSKKVELTADASENSSENDPLAKYVDILV